MPGYRRAIVASQRAHPGMTAREARLGASAPAGEQSNLLAGLPRARPVLLVTLLVRVAFLRAESPLAGIDGTLADYADADLILLAR